MTVPKRERKPSKFEVFHHFSKLRRTITTNLLVNFGYSFAKSEVRLKKKFGGRNYEELSAKDKEVYHKMKEQYEAYDAWYINSEREVLADCMRKITEHLRIANSIYPTNMTEYEQRRMHQNEAIGCCHTLIAEMQDAIESLPVNVNAFTVYAAPIETQIELIKGWRKSDNKFKETLLKKEMTNEELLNKFFERLLDEKFLEELADRIRQEECLLKEIGIDKRVHSKVSATNFANVNSNGNCNYNGASNANGVRPDFDSAAIDK